ncbi:MAG: hypothetical protein KW802_02470 [Candidatus Doudnabacteria bacterium]|nr:hypothetical protein [Candidatus Doudnabacteria bacterium]
MAGLALGAILAPTIKRKLERSEKYQDMKDQMRYRYEEVVDEVADKYAKAKGISRNELTDLVDDLKMHWGRIKQAWNE